MSPTDETVKFMNVETYFDGDGHHWVHDPDNCPCGENRPPVIHTNECQKAMYRGPSVCICGASFR